MNYKEIMKKELGINGGSIFMAEYNNRNMYTIKS